MSEKYNIDVNISMIDDTPIDKDPDTFSRILNKYHEISWSKKLPNGKVLKLQSNNKKPYHLISEDYNMKFSSDNIIHTYSRWKSMSHIISRIDKEYVDNMLKLGTTIGGYIIFPSEKINQKATLNAIRGMHSLIKDRFDLTLECIRRFYLGFNSPLYEHLLRYKDFFDLFVDFKGYVDFFLLNDLVTKNYEGVRLFLHFDDFNTNDVLPTDESSYKNYVNNFVIFVNSRNNRILQYCYSNYIEI